MTAGLGRALGLAGIGVVGGLALVAALFGTDDLLKRARSVIAPAGTPRQAAEPSPGRPEDGREPAQTPTAPGAATGDRAALDPHAAPDRKPQAESPGATDAPPGSAPGGSSGEAPGGSSRGSPSAAAEPAPVEAPSLDLIRVEPSGEAVIAGRGAPNAAVEVLRDNQPIARAVADKSGQFAIVPPALPPGNSEITLRSVGADGTAKPGRESVAVVVAKQRDTKPLVAVSEPDKPTRVLSQPDDPAEDAAKAPARTKAEPRRAEAGKAAPGDRDVPGNPAAQKPAAKETAAKEPVKEPAKVPGEQPGSAEAGGMPGKAAGTPPERTAEKPGGKPGATPPQREAALKAVAKPEGEGAPVKIVAVDAQEGGRLFVSGQATAWASLRLYLNDTLVASGRSGADGRIAFTIGRGVKPGGYQIRIDQVESETGKVRTRAQVAFAFPPQLAAKEPVKEPAREPAKGRAKGPDRAGEPSGREAAARGPETSPAGPKPVAEPASPEPSQAPSRGQAARDQAEEKPPAQKPAAQKLAAQDKPVDEKPAREGPVASREAAPSPPAPGPGAESGEPPRRSGADRNAGTPAAAPPSPEKPAAAAPSAGAASGPEAPASPAQAPDQPGSVFVPEITTARIIRGDNLWQISRRTYGDGRRYTVIYGANQDQIRDPDLIYPGQIFVLPKDDPAKDEPAKDEPAKDEPAADRPETKRG